MGRVGMDLSNGIIFIRINLTNFTHFCPEKIGFWSWISLVEHRYHIYPLLLANLYLNYTLALIVHISSVNSLLLTLSLMHSPMAGSCWVITLLTRALPALMIVERSAMEKTQTPCLQTPLHLPFHFAKRYLGTGTKSWVTVQLPLTWVRESSLTLARVGTTCSSGILVNLAQSVNKNIVKVFVIRTYSEIF